MPTIELTVTHEGQIYAGEYAKIVSTFLGREDHGIFTAYLSLQMLGSGVNIGGYSLDTYDEDLNRRIGTAFGLDQVIRIIETVGADSWEKVAGSEVVLLTQDRFQSLGIASLDGKRIFLFAQHAAGFHSQEG